MEIIIKFLDIHYQNALKLVSDFDITKENDWNTKDYLNELYVQLGHVYNVLFSDHNVNEENRKIDNLGDELSDVLLQLINLARILNINMYDIKNLDSYNYDEVSGLSILLGQVTEAIMEMNQCRFKKDRSGFNSSYEFVKDRLLKMFMITYNIAEKYNLDMIKEFSDMLVDANNFLDKFRKGERKSKEYIDIYDKNENYLGYCEKDKAHEYGYWHKVFGCLIYNKKRNKVFFQLKNPNHNKINQKPLLEITAGGHLISGETLKQGVREIKEETGLNVYYEELKFLDRRTCNKKINKNYIIKEFQYYYSVDLDINIENFKNYDKEEVISFIEFDIHDVLKLLNKKIKSIRGKNNAGDTVKITLDDFDNAFIKDGLYVSLLTKLSIKKGMSSMNKELKKLYKITKKEKKQDPNKFYFDNGKVCNSKDYKKDEIKYCVQIINTDRNINNHIVCLLAIFNHKPIPQLLKREFKSKNGTQKYFNSLCDLIQNNTNQEIIDKCYSEKVVNVEKNIFRKKFKILVNKFNS